MRVVLLAALFLTGCHHKFKKNAPFLEEVNTHVVVSGGPYVQLGHVGGDSLISAVVNVVQDVRGLALSPRVAKAVKLEDLNEAVASSFNEALGDGPPFAHTDAAKAPATVQLELLAYGLAVPYLGAPGVFTYDMRVRIYRQDGERVYSTRMHCEVGVGTPNAASVVLGAVNNVKQLDKLTDAEINDAFATTASWCGQQLVIKMRRHAG